MIWPILSVSAALGAVITAILVLLRPRERSPAAFFLALALTFSALLEGCDLAAAFRPEAFIAWKKGALAAEAFLPALWLAYALTFARSGGMAPLQRFLLAVCAALPSPLFFLPVEDLLFAPDFAAERLLFLRPAGHLLYAGGILILVLALIQLERTLLALPGPQRWKVKFELVGAGAILSMLLIYDGQALLYRVIDMNLAPARGAALAAGAALIAFSRLRRGGRVAVRVSRQLAFRSVVLLLLGSYLVGLGLLEEGVRHFGHGFGRAAVWMVGMAGGVALLACLLSERYQRKLRVLIHKHFYKSKYDYRRQWLACTERIASARTEGELRGTILSLFCSTFAVKGAVLYQRHPESGDFISTAFHETEASAPLLTRNDSLLLLLGGREWVLDPRETPPDAASAATEFLASRKISFIVPLVFDRALEGMICLGEAVDPAETYIYEDFDLMKTLARQAVSTILNMRLADQLVESREMAAAGRISAYLLHDLKNLVSSLALVVDNAEVHLEDPEFRRDMLGTLTNTVQRMRRLVARLKNLEGKGELLLGEWNLGDVAREAAALVQGEIRVVGETVLARVDREEMVKVVLNLLVNALEAGGEPVEVETAADGEGPFLRVIDRGCGMSEDFVRRHLFRPFRTTKAGGFGIGLYQCRSIVEAHGGHIHVESRPAQGSRFTIRFSPFGEHPAAEGDHSPARKSADPAPSPLPVPDPPGETCSVRS